MKHKDLQAAKPIPVKLDRRLLERIDAMADKLGEAKSTVMRIAMRVGLAGLEKAFEADPSPDLTSLIAPGEIKNYPQHEPQVSLAEDAPAKPSSALGAVEKLIIRDVQKLARGEDPPKGRRSK